MSRNIILATIAVFGLALTGCANGGQDPETAPTAAQETSQPSAEPTAEETAGAPMEEERPSTASSSGEYAFATGMTFGKFEIPGEPREDFLKIMKRYDEDVEDVSFLQVKVDNRESDVEAAVMEVRGYDADGNEYLFVGPEEILDTMFAEDQSKMDYDKEYMKFFDEFTDSASPGEVQEFTLISMDKLPDEFARVMVDAGGSLGEVEAVTMEEAKEQGYPLDF